MKSATAFAPATVGNAAVGFDVLGFPVEATGDRVTVTRVKQSGVKIISITGVPGLPTDPEKNTATVGLIHLLKDQKADFGFEVSIVKGIPLGSGMGGSAASAVGALVAANSVLDEPLDKKDLLKYTLLGEMVASGAAHADNISPCLFGGLTIVLGTESGDVVRVPVPSTIRCVLVHPELRLDTRDSRKVLKPTISLKDYAHQSALLSGFIAGCFQNDISLIGRTLVDLIIEPQRASLIQGFASVKAAALEAGALGCSISGSGPSVFAWASSDSAAVQIKQRMTGAFEKAGVKISGAWISPISSEGAKLI
jgi:homoserine kinase